VAAHLAAVGQKEPFDSIMCVAPKRSVGQGAAECDGRPVWQELIRGFKG